MQNYQTGIIMPSILIFIGLLSGLVILLFQLGLFNLKAATILQQHSQFKAVLENTLVMVETTQLNNSKTCEYSEPQGANYFAQQSIDWWLQHGCKDEAANPPVYYVIELIHQLPCVWIINDSIKEIAQANFYRITAKVIPTEVNLINLMAQSVYVTQQITESQCQPSMTIFIGRQSLRAITETLNF